MSALDADALATLTPEERAAIEDTDHTPQELEAIKKIAGTDAPNDDGDDGDDDESDDGGTGGESQPVERPVAETSKPAEEYPQAQEQTAEQETTTYQASLPSDYEERLSGLKARDAELRQKLRDGEIDIDERDAGLAAIAEEREQLLVLRAKAEVSQEMNSQTVARQWAGEINSLFKRASENDGVDYSKDRARYNDLDIFVKALANNEANEGKPMSWFLNEAHKRVMALHGDAPAKVNPPANKDAAIKEANEKRKPPMDQVPKTLSHVPGSDGPGDVASEFADIDALEGEALEDAIKRMTPAQREKWAKG